MRFRLRLCLLTAASVVIVAVGMPTPALALGPNAILPGFNSTTYGANDDGSWPCVSSGIGTPGGCTPAKLTLPFSFNFFGTTYNQLYLNNNGNLTFDTPLSTFTPFPILSTLHVIIAPFFADVDTRVGNLVTFGSGTVSGHNAWGVNWPGVGCFNANNSVLDYFQVILIDRTDTGAGNFDIMFNYDQIQWDTGQASGGDPACLGTSGSARAGYSNGIASSFELPGSGISSALLDSNAATGLIHHTLNCSGQLGCYVFGVRNGTPQVSDLSVTKTGPATAVLGQSVTYQIVATNNGPTDATGVTVTDALPAGATLTSGSSSGTCTGTGPVICAIGNLASGSSATITLVATLNTPGANVDTATVTGDQPDPNAANNTASVSTLVASKASPTITTSATSATVGGTVSDTATLSGGTLTVGGTITFTAFGPNDPTCALPAAFTSAPITVSGNGNYSSGSFTPVLAGTYLWVATYSGDPNNNSAMTVCGASSSETSTLAKASPTITTSATANATVGGTVSDTATLSGGTLTVGGTITFTLFGPNDATCALPAAFTSAPITVSGNGNYSSGSFTPVLAGTYLWVATYSGDPNNGSAMTACGATGETSAVFAFAPGGGSFVIGDQNAAAGNSVTFWGAQWAKDNPTSGGSAPRSFKGFAENPTTPICGAVWTADTGNSTPPPAGPLPEFMAVIVTSQASQSGSTDSGTIVHIVIVQTNPGYAPNPGHPGTGTVVAVVC